MLAKPASLCLLVTAHQDSFLFLAWDAIFVCLDYCIRLLTCFFAPGLTFQPGHHTNLWCESCKSCNFIPCSASSSFWFVHPFCLFCFTCAISLAGFWKRTDTNTCLTSAMSTLQTNTNFQIKQYKKQMASSLGTVDPKHLLQEGEDSS